MDFESFKHSVTTGDKPPGLSLALQALWAEGRGDWDGAHELAQADSGRTGAWVHAYLHRKEGDESNAAYWYGQASQDVYQGSLDSEWESIARSLLLAD